MGGFVGYSIPIYKGFKVPQEKANNQTPQREFSVECDWQPQVTSQEIERKMITSHFHFLISFWTFGIYTNSQQKNHQKSTKKIHSVPVFQAPRHGVIALSLCRLQWPVREGQRSPTGERSQCNELRGFGCMGSSSENDSKIPAYSCFGLIEHASRDTGQFLNPPIFDCTGAKAHPTHDMERKKWASQIFCHTFSWVTFSYIHQLDQAYYHLLPGPCSRFSRRIEASSVHQRWLGEELMTSHCDFLGYSFWEQKEHTHRIIPNSLVK